MQELEIKEFRNRYAVFAGVSRLSRLYKTVFEARNDLESNLELYKYYAGSASVSIENSSQKVIELNEIGEVTREYVIIR